MNTTNCLNHKSHGKPGSLAARWNYLICVIVLSLLRVSCDGNTYIGNFIHTRTTPSYGGTISGGGAVSPPGSAQTLTATPKVGYAFENWTDEAGNVVSTSASFSYTLAPDHFVFLVAHFTLVGGGGGDWRALSVTVRPHTVQAAPGDDFGYVATVRDGWGEPVFNASVFLDKPASWPADAFLRTYFSISGDVVNPTDGYGQFTARRNVPPGTAAGTYTVNISARKQGYTSAATSAKIEIVAPQAQLPVFIYSGWATELTPGATHRLSKAFLVVEEQGHVESARIALVVGGSSARTPFVAPFDTAEVHRPNGVVFTHWWSKLAVPELSEARLDLITTNRDSLLAGHPSKFTGRLAETKFATAAVDPGPGNPTGTPPQLPDYSDSSLVLFLDQRRTNAAHDSHATLEAVVEALKAKL